MPEDTDISDAAAATSQPVASSTDTRGAKRDRTRPVAPEIKEEFVSHLSVLRAFALSLTRNGTRADDLVQETVMKAWANLHSYTPGTNMRAWLFTKIGRASCRERVYTKV